MTERSQFDNFLGGSQELPPEVQVLKLASARANEIAAMTYSIDNPHQTKLIFQKLPVHMRRRVMSHNAKRMPRRLRENHIRQMSKSGLPPKVKRPSRKYRRRPTNLIADYKRRQINKFWLETHVWHAKRFRIVDKWGYKIPERSNNRCFRASYRAVAKHCLIQDISYYSCVELKGPGHILEENLKQHCDQGGLTFSAKSYILGNREGTLMFYRRNGYPESPLGTVQFIWRPGHLEEKTIWIWVHPSFYREFLSEICASFGFDIDSSLPPFSRSPSSYTSIDNCRIVLLRNCLNRFRLYGPLSLALLTDALRLPELGNSSEETKCTEKTDDSISNVVMDIDLSKSDSDSDVEVLGSPKKKNTEAMEVENVDNGRSEAPESIQQSWHVEYYKDSDNSQSFQVQRNVFELLKELDSPNQLPPGIVMAFTVLDPRFYVPKKRTKSQIAASTFETIPVPPTLVNLSPLWETSVRESVIKDSKTANEINKLRSENLVPGVFNDDKYDQNTIAKLPIIFVQRPGSRGNEKRIGFSSGIDVILPSGWAQPFWISFILRCGKPGGLRESRSVILENLSLNSPDFNAPDTAAYAQEALETKYGLLEKYFRRPPNRRVNYVKFGISSPFYCEWNLLMKEWTESEKFYVLRERKLLNYLQKSISFQSLTMGYKKRRKSNEKSKEFTKFSFDKTIFKLPNLLVAVKISIENKGCPRDFAIICSPSLEDLDNWRKNRNWSGPVAQKKKDPNESIRKNLRRGHLALLKRLRRQRVRQRLKSESNNEKGSLDSNGATDTAKKLIKKKAQTAIDLQAERMKNLYLPKCETVRYSCDREVMGYVVKGDFSFTESKGIGLGYVTLTSIFDLIERGSDVLLIRNTKSRQYRIARLSILS